MFTYLGKSKMMLGRKIVPAVFWHDIPRGGGTDRFFFVRPVDSKRYHLRIVVGTVITTDMGDVGRGEVSRAARLMGIYVEDSHWSEVDALR